MLTWKSFLKGIISFRYDLPPTEAKRWILHFKRIVSLKWQSKEPSWQNRISCALFLLKRKSLHGRQPSPFSIRRRAQTMFERKDLTLSYTLFAVPSLPYISLKNQKISLSPLSWKSSIFVPSFPLRESQSLFFQRAHSPTPYSDAALSVRGSLYTIDLIWEASTLL